MKKITAVLVDDMPIALDLLSKSIEQAHQEIEIIGTAKPSQFTFKNHLCDR